MTKNTFQVGEDPDGRQFLYQAVHEGNKNHDENDDEPTTEARIYEIEGKSSLPSPVVNICKHNITGGITSLLTNACNSKHFFVYSFTVGSEICPVWIFKLYISKLNDKRNELWQRPKANINNGHAPEWYNNQVIGRDPLNDTMKTISKNA